MFEFLGNIKEEYLSDEHLSKLQEFRCSDEPIVENFLKEEAYNLMKRNLVRTRLFFDDNQNLIGFYSLFNDTIKINKQKRMQLEIYLPQGVTEIPAIRLHYLGVDERFRGNGFGAYLMVSVLYNCAKVAEITGCSLITVESTEKAKSFYEKFDFTYICPTDRYYLMALNTKPLVEELIHGRNKAE
jgi:GNAT superfamily N-acetyltransferase